MDKTTLATELPVFLTSKETERIFKQKGGLLGNIDFLQGMESRVKILDHKPNAAKEKHAVDQLLAYGITLQTRTYIHLEIIDCG